MAQKKVTKPPTGKVASERVYGPLQQRPSTVLWGRVENPDVVAAKFGGPDGLAIYDVMPRNWAPLEGIIEQRIDRVAAIERRIVAGDAASEMSLRMAEDARTWWRNLPYKDVILRRLLRGFFTGIAPIEKVFGKCEASGLLAPTALYDLPPHTILFGPEGEEYFVTEMNPRGLLVEPGKLFFFRWGSTWTPHGQGEGREVYQPYWYAKIVMQYGLQAIEELGRPVWWVKYPSRWDDAKIRDLETNIAAQHSVYLLTPAEIDAPEVDNQTQAIAASGSAGRAELEFLAQMERWAYIRILGTAQTQDKTGGSRALEETRSGITDSKTPAMSDALDESLTHGLLDSIGMLNWRDRPRQEWPRFASDTTDVNAEGFDGPRAAAAERIILRVVAREIPVAAAEELLASLGMPRARVAYIVQAAVDERDELKPVSVGIKAPGAGEESGGEDA